MNFSEPEIRVVSPLEPSVRHILETHYDFCTASTPIEHVHALDVAKLSGSDITLFGAFIDDEIVGVGAMRVLATDHAELKSMHTLARYRGRGIASSLVKHIIETARFLGMARLSLETGTSNLFEPARKLYLSFGFEPAEAFGEYENTEDNICMSMSLN